MSTIVLVRHKRGNNIIEEFWSVNFNGHDYLIDSEESVLQLLGNNYVKVIIFRTYSSQIDVFKALLKNNNNKIVLEPIENEQRVIYLGWPDEGEK